MDWVDQFVKMLFPVSKYELNVEGAFLLKQQHIPTSIFKYRSINPFAIRDLENDTIWLADPMTFNDPYDSAFSIDYAFSLDRFFIEGFDTFLNKSGVTNVLSKEQLDQIRGSNDPINQILKMLYKDVEENKRQRMEEFFYEVSKKLCNETLQDFNATVKESFRICSFSTNGTCQ